MGGIAKAISKPFKSVAKTVSKVVKKTAQAIKKVGNAVMKGVAKISNKLGPVGMIALSIAMPYALAGLSSMTTAAMASTNPFLQAVGTVGNAIRTGYQAFNAKVAQTFSSITNSISKAFTQFAPESVKNMYSSISSGAKNLYQKSIEAVNKYMPKPFTAKAGTVDIYGSIDPGVSTISTTDAASMLERGTLSASELGQQTITQRAGLFTSANQADKIVSETINNAYAERLKGFGPNATRMFTDVKSYAEKMGTYVNDEQIGSYIENNIGSNRYTTPIEPGKYAVKTDTNLLKTGDYTALNEEGTEFLFNGNETFKSPPVKSAFDEAKKNAKDKIVSAGKGYVGSLLSPGTTPTPQQPSYYAGATGMDTDVSTGYGGTDIKGTAGGNLVAQVFGENAANRISNYYRNMNILSSVG